MNTEVGIRLVRLAKVGLVVVYFAGFYAATQSQWR